MLLQSVLRRTSHYGVMIRIDTNAITAVPNTKQASDMGNTKSRTREDGHTSMVQPVTGFDTAERDAQSGVAYEMIRRNEGLVGNIQPKQQRDLLTRLCK